MKKKEFDDENDNDNERNSSDSDEQDNEEIVIELVEQTIDQQIDGISIYFKLSTEEEKQEEDATKAKLTNELHKKADEEIFPKRVSRVFYKFYSIKHKLDKANKESHIQNKLKMICL